MLQTHPSKGVQKNMMKACNFTKCKLRHRWFHNDLQRNFQTNIIENDTAQILLIVVLMVVSCLDNYLTCKLQNDTIFTWFQRDISAWILKPVLCPPGHGHSGPCQLSARCSDMYLKSSYFGGWITEGCRFTTSWR